MTICARGSSRIIRPTFAGPLLVAQQPSGDTGIAPGAEAQRIPPQTFSVSFVPGSSVGAGSYAIEDGVTVRGDRWRPSASSEDQRFDGSATFCGNDLQHDRAEGGNMELGFAIGQVMYRTETDDGAWQGGSLVAEWVDPESSEMRYSGDLVLLVGEGDYEGLYAAMHLEDDGWVGKGVVFEGALPTAPEPPPNSEVGPAYGVDGAGDGPGSYNRRAHSPHTGVLMTLTENQRSAIETWTNEHWVGRATCPAGHDAWSVAPTMSFMPGFVVTDAGPKIAHERGFTFVVLTCTECAYVAFLDTKTIGVSLAG